MGTDAGRRRGEGETEREGRREREPRRGAVSGPASRPSPTDPALRANPCPEVTDLTCRLPLPTLFYRPEAVHLGDLLRIWVRPGTIITGVSLGFSRAGGGAPDATRPAALLGAAAPISGRADSRRVRPLQRKENSSRGRRRRLRVRLRRRTGRAPETPPPGHPPLGGRGPAEGREDGDLRARVREY